MVKKFRRGYNFNLLITVEEPTAGNYTYRLRYSPLGATEKKAVDSTEKLTDDSTLNNVMAKLLAQRLKERFGVKYISHESDIFNDYPLDIISVGVPFIIKDRGKVTYTKR